MADRWRGRCLQEVGRGFGEVRWIGRSLVPGKLYQSGRERLRKVTVREAVEWTLRMKTLAKLRYSRSCLPGSHVTLGRRSTCARQGQDEGQR